MNARRRAGGPWLEVAFRVEDHQSLHLLRMHYSEGFTLTMPRTSLAIEMSFLFKVPEVQLSESREGVLDGV